MTISDSSAPTARTHAPAAVRVVHTEPRHARDVAAVVRRAHGIRDDEPCPSCPTPAMVLRQIRRFPEGQLVAVNREDETQVVGAGMLMRTDYPPTAPPRSWLRMVGGLSLRNHDPRGRWLYGVELAVDPDAQGRGVGSALYEARLALVEELGLAGMYAGGMLKGYQHYRDRLTPVEYGECVRRGEIEDPTVSMQLRRGFEAVSVIEGYEDDEESGDCAMLIVWRARAAGAKLPTGDGEGPAPSA